MTISTIFHKWILLLPVVMVEAFLGGIICFYPGPVVPALICALAAGLICFCFPWAGLVIIVLLLPIGNLDYSITFGSITIRMFQIFALPTAMGWLLATLLKKESEPLIKWSPINHAIAVITFWFFFSLLWSHNLGGWLSKNIQWMLCLVLFFMSLSLINSRDRIRKMVLLWVCVGCVAGIVSLAQFFFQGMGVILKGGIPEQWGAVRSSSVFKEPNDLALFMRYPFLLLMSVYPCLEKGRDKTAAFLIIGIMALGVLFTFSRGATLSLAGGVALMVLRHAAIRKLVVRAVLVSAVVILISGKGILVYNAISERLGSSFHILMADDKAVNEDVGYLVRISNWAAGVSIFMDNPVLGVGPGGYQGQAGHLLSGSDHLSTLGLNADKPYNLYLDILVSYGLVGFLLFIIMVVSIFYYCLKGAGSGSDLLYQNISFCGAVLLIVLLAKGVTGEVFFESGQLWLFLGLVMSVIKRESNAR
ncbi:MAG: O-antigen ligase family protein [Desulfobacteraceae bacterium]